MYMHTFGGFVEFPTLNALRGVERGVGGEKKKKKGVHEYI